MVQPQRKLMLGDEWIFYKIYSGPQFLEDLLLGELKDFAESLYRTGDIDKFFFIRYNDEGYHLRLRFNYRTSEALYTIIEGIGSICRPLLNDRIISRVVVDTYSREFERYGAETMSDVETIFSIDSLSVLNNLYIARQRNEQNFWLYCIRDIDGFLTNIGFTLLDKHEFYYDYYKALSGKHQAGNLKITLDQKYRACRQDIDAYMSDESAEKRISYFDSKQSINAIENILSMRNSGILSVPFISIVRGIVHMHFNRFFRSKANTYELAIYYFLAKHYKSAYVRSEKVKEILVPTE